MYTLEANITVEPKDIWKYFTENKVRLLNDMQIVAENDDFDVVIYLTNNDGKPYLSIESSNVKNTEFELSNDDSCAVEAEKIYNRYLTDEIMTVIAEEEMEADIDIDIEEAMIEREADIDSFFERLIEDLFPDEPIIYSELMNDLVSDVKEHLLEYLYRKHGLSVYRPMELEDDEGVFIEDYPYEYMEFDPNPMYDDFEVTDLAINGNDIIALGIPQGKEVGDTLDKLRKFVVGGIIPNDHDKLIEFLKAIKK